MAAIARERSHTRLCGNLLSGVGIGGMLARATIRVTATTRAVAFSDLPIEPGDPGLEVPLDRTHRGVDVQVALPYTQDGTGDKGEGHPQKQGTCPRIRQIGRASCRERVSIAV